MNFFSFDNDDDDDNEIEPVPEDVFNKNILKKPESKNVPGGNILKEPDPKNIPDFFNKNILKEPEPKNDDDVFNKNILKEPVQDLNKIKGSESNKVLVLCQRKKGNDIYGQSIQNVIDKINNVVQQLIGNNYNITYMSKLTEEIKGEVDIDCRLDGITDCSKKFIEENTGSFDIIIIQTCPFQIMNYNIIYNLLKPNGIMVLSSFPINITKLFFKTQPIAIASIESSNFILEDNNKIEEIIIYKKVKRDGRKSKRNRRKSKRSRKHYL